MDNESTISLIDELHLITRTQREGRTEWYADMLRATMIATAAMCQSTLVSDAQQGMGVIESRRCAEEERRNLPRDLARYVRVISEDLHRDSYLGLSVAADLAIWCCKKRTLHEALDAFFQHQGAQDLRKSLNDQGISVTLPKLARYIADRMD